MPGDLAASPVIGRKRQFEGFRGFGTLRPGEMLDDVTATGLRLVQPVAAPPQPAEQAPSEAPQPSAEPPVVPVPIRPDARVVT
ncbi:hypothetical protein J8J27_29270, partial [Mycobacterium tuberculosis]|nr:hypothetical protein [Mycobacterium tuberculosis]